MKNPLYGLLIAPRNGMREAVLSGEKAITIREGHRDYREGGQVLIGCMGVKTDASWTDAWVVMADVDAVRHCLLGEVTEDELRADGYNSREEMLADLHAYYPKLDLVSPVTVLRWKNVRGKLVDEYQRQNKNC